MGLADDFGQIGRQEVHLAMTPVAAQDDEEIVARRIPERSVFAGIGMHWRKRDRHG